MVSGDAVALLDTETLPLILPAETGAKVTLKVAFCPGDKISPVGIPPAENPGPEIVTLETVTGAFPEFVIVTESVLLVPKVTLEKFRFV